LLLQFYACQRRMLQTRQKFFFRLEISCWFGRGLLKRKQEYWKNSKNRKRLRHFLWLKIFWGDDTLKFILSSNFVFHLRECSIILNWRFLGSKFYVLKILIINTTAKNLVNFLFIYQSPAQWDFENFSMLLTQGCCWHSDMYLKLSVYFF